jgi:molybdopterin-guanine dinucleotide biosynthesis protein A
MSVPRDRVTAVVLVGGASTRMGRDKATLVPGDGDPRMLVQRALDALSGCAGTALLAGAAIDGLDVAAVPDRNGPAAGPLAGIAAGLAAVQTDLAVVAACDMPSIAPPLVAHLLERAAADPHALCVLCASSRGLEPLLAVWRPTAAPLLDDALQRGVRALHRVVAALPHIVVEPQEWRRHDPDGASFVNWNTPADLPRR